MSRVEGMAAIASKRLAAQAELQQLIAGTGSLLAAGTSLGEQAIAVCYTRSGDRTTHTQEFYPEGFYDLEQAAKMLQIHQIFGGKCMYEMFCDAAGGIVDVIAPGEIVEGLDHIGRGYAVSGDDTYLYLGIASDFLTVIRKSDWSIVPGTPYINTSALSVVNDDNYVYTAHLGGNGYSIVRKSDWSLVPDTTPLVAGWRNESYGLDIHVDADHVYIAHYGGQTYTILNKSDWSLVTDLPNIPKYSDTVSTGIHADADYVCIAHYGGIGYSIARKSDWSLVGGLPAIAGLWSTRAIHADADYVYVAHTGGLCYTILRKSDWSLVETTVKMPVNSNRMSSAIDITADSNYVYITSGAVGRLAELVVLRKSDWSQVEGIPPSPNMPDQGGEIHLDANYLYIPQRATPGLIITPRPTN